jgi:hypothetical protein
MANNLKRPFINYMTDIGFTYLVIPINKDPNGGGTNAEGSINNKYRI